MCEAAESPTLTVVKHWQHLSAALIAVAAVHSRKQALKFKLNWRCLSLPTGMFVGVLSVGFVGCTRVLPCCRGCCRHSRWFAAAAGSVVPARNTVYHPLVTPRWCPLFMAFAMCSRCLTSCLLLLVIHSSVTAAGPLPSVCCGAGAAFRAYAAVNVYALL